MSVPCPPLAGTLPTSRGPYQSQGASCDVVYEPLARVGGGNGTGATLGSCSTLSESGGRDSSEQARFSCSFWRFSSACSQLWVSALWRMNLPECAPQIHLRQLQRRHSLSLAYCSLDDDGCRRTAWALPDFSGIVLDLLKWGKNPEGNCTLAA